MINFNNNDKLINKVKPYLIFTGTIHADEGCPLYEDMRSEKFNECTIGEYIAEKELLLNLIEIYHATISDCIRRMSYLYTVYFRRIRKRCFLSCKTPKKPLARKNWSQSRGECLRELLFDYKIINFFDKHCDVNYNITARWRASLPNYGTTSRIRWQLKRLRDWQEHCYHL